jgi:2,4-dienoyl-CoA reductase-like NADH-dependent reductase (Old Yellow Enzyme family)
MTAHDTLGILQLVHTGRQSVRCAGRLPFTPPMAPSAIRVNTHPSNVIGRIVESIAFQTPKEMTIQDIQEVIRKFVHGAKLAKKSGLHGVEIHASHGYLISSFLSPRTNRRKDTYGGSTEARLKILLEIIGRIRIEVERPLLLGVKLNSADYVDGGLSEEEALRHVELLTRQGGLDFIEVRPSIYSRAFDIKLSRRIPASQISGGSYESLAFLDADSAPARSARTAAREAIFSAFSSRAKAVAIEAAQKQGTESEKATGIEATVPLIMCTGGFRSRQGIQQAL